MRRQPKRKRIAGVLVALCVSAIAACGGTDDTPQEPEWTTTRVAGVALPADKGSEEKNPQKRHSESGAVETAVLATVLLDTAKDADYGDIVRTYVADGQGKVNWVAAMARVSITTQTITNPPTITGYRFTDYTDERAELALFSTQTDGSILALKRTLLWTDNGWMIELPAKPGGVMEAPDKLPDDTILFTPKE